MIFPPIFKKEAVPPRQFTMIVLTCEMSIIYYVFEFNFVLFNLFYFIISHPNKQISIINQSLSKTLLFCVSTGDTGLLVYVIHLHAFICFKTFSYYFIGYKKSSEYIHQNTDLWVYV